MSSSSYTPTSGNSSTIVTITTINVNAYNAAVAGGVILADADGIPYLNPTINVISGVTPYIFTFAVSGCLFMGNPAPPGQYTVYTAGASPPGSTVIILPLLGFDLLANPVICFKENTKILCYESEKEKEINVQDLKKNTLVKTLCNGYLPVNVVGKNVCYNPKTNERIKDRLYKLSKDKYPELREDLVVTGCHSILVDHITEEQRSKINKDLGRVYVTDNKYRLMTYVDERSEVYTEECGDTNVYHIALGSDESRNYGIYANGLLVESCFINRVKNEMNVIS